MTFDVGNGGKKEAERRQLPRLRGGVGERRKESHRGACKGGERSWDR